MSDVFEEVSEDIRRENMTKLWKKYGPVVIGICVLVIAAVAGSKFYENYQISQAVNASNAYNQYLEALAVEGNAENKGGEALKTVEATGHAGYIFLSQMSQADAYVADKNIIEAVKIYDVVAADNSLSQNNRDIATVKSAYLLVDSISLADITKRLEKINVVENAFRFQARELIGLSAFKAGDFKLANETFASLSQNAQTPESIRARAGQIIALLVSKI